MTGVLKTVLKLLKISIKQPAVEIGELLYYFVENGLI